MVPTWSALRLTVVISFLNTSTLNISLKILNKFVNVCYVNEHNPGAKVDFLSLTLNPQLMEII